MLPTQCSRWLAGSSGAGSANLHKTTLTLATLTLLLLPLASAGPGGSVETLDASGGCDHAYDEWSTGNGTNETGWWAWSRSSFAGCSDHMDYAVVEAHDDDGTLARASLTADHANGTTYGQQGGGSWSEAGGISYYDQHHSATTRGTGARPSRRGRAPRTSRTAAPSPPPARWAGPTTPGTTRT